MRHILLLLAAIGAFAACGTTTLFVQVPTTPMVTAPIAVGILAPIDKRNWKESSPPWLLRSKWAFVAAGGAVMTFKDAKLRSDSSLRFENGKTLSESIGRYIHSTTKKNATFRQSTYIPAGHDLVALSRQTGLRYFLTTDIIHHFALQYIDRLSVSSQSSTTSGNIKTTTHTTYVETNSTATFSTTSLRFELVLVENGQVRTLWRSSCRGTDSTGGKPNKVSGGRALGKCLRRFSRNLGVLTAALQRWLGRGASPQLRAPVPPRAPVQPPIPALPPVPARPAPVQPGTPVQPTSAA